MDAPSPSIRDLAGRLLALEAASQEGANSRVHEAVRVCEKLRVCLIRFAGADGFTALLRRALALSRAEVSEIQGITETADGSLDGLGEVAVLSSKSGTDAGSAITAHLLGLLVTLIGEPLTVRLVREAWPDISCDDQSRSEANL
jgi:hypothetical protein